MVFDSLKVRMPDKQEQNGNGGGDKRFKRWLFQGVKEIEGPYEREHTHHAHHPWYKVMCLTGVDYFSTLGYQPGIAFLAASYLSPIATLILVLLTLLGALPIYRRVAAESPKGEGSIAMMENLLSRWKGKLAVLVLLGFVATDFVITITLSAADATAHVLENPFVHTHLPFLEHPVLVTLGLVAVLGAVFLKGFKEAIGIAVVLVATYLSLNFIVLGVGLYEVFTHPDAFSNWQTALFVNPHGGNYSIFFLIGLALVSFPRLALGLSGFETGVAVMPLIDNPEPRRKDEKAPPGSGADHEFYADRQQRGHDDADPARSSVRRSPAPIRSIFQRIFRRASVERKKGALTARAGLHRPQIHGRRRLERCMTSARS